MKFGPVPTADAEGAILAHSLDIGAMRMRKGIRLTPEAVSQLLDAKIEVVTVARLESGDVHEDDGAERLANALVGGQGDALRLTKPSTGRVNVIAVQAGLAQIDADAITQANSVDPMITIATIPPFSRVEPGQLLATIKIISYAVPDNRLERASNYALGALCLIEPVMKSVALLETRTSTSPVSDKGANALRKRLDRLGVSYSGREVVDHDVISLAKAIVRTDADVVCILTGSATSDILDVAPMAVREAGGKIVHFGMPVDPGNLLFLAKNGPQHIIGLPGCARSIALNGADWVLERVLCGVGVTSADIAAMGVGGLLKEIPSRPRPRRKSEG